MRDGSGKKHAHARKRKLRAAKHEAWLVKQPGKKKRAARPDRERTLADVTRSS